MIGRADEQGTPCVAQASQCRIHVWGLFAEPIWASGHHAASKAGHMTAVAPPSNSAALPLHPRGRPHMQQSRTAGLLRSTFDLFAHDPALVELVARLRGEYQSLGCC
jgi:hypothetical protein